MKLRYILPLILIPLLAFGGSTRTSKNRLQKTMGVATSYANYDDGYYDEGSSISPRYVDTPNNTVIDRVANLEWITDPIIMLPGSAINGTNTIRVARGNFESNATYNVGDIINDCSGSTLGFIHVCVTQHVSLSGIDWQTNYVYAPNSYAVDTDLSSVWQCMLAHTSAVSGTFADDRAGGASGYWSEKTTTNELWSVEVYAHSDKWRVAPFCGSADNLTTPLAMKWGDAITCSHIYSFGVDLEYNGHTGWRLANINELNSLVSRSIDVGNVCPAIALYYEGYNYGHLWSSTTFHSDETIAWSVSTYEGTCAPYGTKDSYTFFVFPVRTIK